MMRFAGFRTPTSFMAFVMRRWKILLVLNVFTVVGFITFWGKCNLRAIKAQQAAADTRLQTHTNGSAQEISISHDVLLKRLGSLEDVVYRQLNGLSKSLGLIEGFGGRGRGGLPATLLPMEEKEAKYLREKYGYNAFLSDKISLDRSIPDYRPSKCKRVFYPRDLPQISIIFIFVNEALSVILRSVHSAVNHTPAHLLKEIILVDDNSDDEQLKGPLEEYVNKRYPCLIKIVRNQKREGLIRARIEGWKVATGEVTGFFDAHVEFTPAWAEPVLSRIKENHKRIILPSVDNIKDETFELERYENSGHGYNWELWCMYISPPKQWWDEGDTSAPIRTPAMIGCSFAVNREYFGELGLLDAGMDVYGGENIELGIRVWLCGGSMEVLPCSRVAHIARTKKPYHSNIAFHTRRNALRVAEVWMDQYKPNVYLAWNLPMKNHGIDYGDISQRVELRKKLECKNFEWYLDNIYPEMRIYNDTLFYGEIRNTNVTHLCVDQGIKENHTATLHPCHGWGPQLGRYTKEGYLFLGPLGSTGEDTRCVVDDKISRYPQLLNCEKFSSVSQKTWHFAQNESIINRATGRCLEIVQANVYFGYALVLRACTGQRWNFKNTLYPEQGQ
ncbi:putative polypeptide N-acetylgalactosaminyltransferase-like protein 3 [Triplophysa rosa]|uniref:Polypeptide N-acetylgalactosaminyltransferase n=1 Tax=Triplophysa rosa TaxID=992332 RepID=A0A9W7TRR5_TRIRA|nr:putative polypeptide N-acetylgalactosaminyltransferase-like protein 3 [Triplophysa rosa]